jgi:hypothetical protein
MVMTPVPTTLPATEPDMVPKAPLAAIAAWAGPPRVWPVSAKANLSSTAPAPMPSSSTPKTMKTRIRLTTTDSGPPNTPSKEYQVTCSTCWKEKPPWRRDAGQHVAEDRIGKPDQADDEEWQAHRPARQFQEHDETERAEHDVGRAGTCRGRSAAPGRSPCSARLRPGEDASRTTSNRMPR